MSPGTVEPSRTLHGGLGKGKLCLSKSDDAEEMQVATIPTEEQVLHHLGYEWWMFRTMHHWLLALPEDEDPARFALVESLVVHGRNLGEFFFGEQEGPERHVGLLGLDREEWPEPVLE